LLYHLLDTYNVTLNNDSNRHELLSLVPGHKRIKKEFCGFATASGLANIDPEFSSGKGLFVSVRQYTPPPSNFFSSCLLMVQDVSLYSTVFPIIVDESRVPALLLFHYNDFILHAMIDTDRWAEKCCTLTSFCNLNKLKMVSSVCASTADKNRQIKHSLGSTVATLEANGDFVCFCPPDKGDTRSQLLVSYLQEIVEYLHGLAKCAYFFYFWDNVDFQSNIFTN